MIEDTDVFRVKIGRVWPRNDIPEDHVEEWTPPAVADVAEVEDTGVFFFRRDILDQLPGYFEHVEVMRREDPEAYALYGKLGGTLIPPRTLLDSTGQVRVGHPDELPAFSCIVISAARDKREDEVPGRFIYYQKMTGAIPGVEFTTDTIFKVTLFYSEGKTGRRLGLPVEYHVSVAATGHVTVLKHYATDWQSMTAKRGAVRRYSIPSQGWRYPYYLRSLARENNRDPAEVGKTAFSLVANAAPKMDIGFQVRVVNAAGAVAVFNIANKRTPYFFKDRDLMVNENGRKKRVFHFVGEYMKSDGKTVKAHTKGLRSFSWNGYRVHIGKPGFDFADLRDLKAPGRWLANEDPIPAGNLTMEQVGRHMLAHFLAGLRTPDERRL